VGAPNLPLGRPSGPEPRFPHNHALNAAAQAPALQRAPELPHAETAWAAFTDNQATTPCKEDGYVRSAMG